MKLARGVASSFLFLSAGFSLSALPAGEVEVDFEFHQGHLILVQAALVDQQALRVVIDTGATHSFISEKSAQRLGLTFLPDGATAKSFGRSTKTRRVILRGLRLGPMTVTIPCYAGKLPWNKVDLIAGLDILRRTDFTIDYAARKIRFGQADPLSAAIPIQAGEETLVIVPVHVGQQALRLSLDTGAERLTVFRDRMKTGIGRVNAGRKVTVHHVAGVSDAQEVVLSDLSVGERRFQDLPAILLSAPGPSDRDGVLSPHSLGVRRIAFEFSRSLVSWEP